MSTAFDVHTDDNLGCGRFVDIDHPLVRDFARDHAGGGDDTAKALDLYYAVRDGIRYDAYLPMGDPKSYRASDAVASGVGWCVPKSALLAACARLHGIPARPCYADVRNHLATPKLLEMMGCDIFYWHSYCELYLEGAWVKATPVFNLSLCEKFGLNPLEFDGRTDSLFHEFDRAGNRHMEYIYDRGPFADVPFEDITATFRAEYRPECMQGDAGDFEADAAESGHPSGG